MGFSDWNNNNQGGQTGFEGGFNAEDYMTNLDRITDKSEGGLLQGFWEAAKVDHKKHEQSWMQGMKQAELAYQEGRHFRERENELYGETKEELAGMEKKSLNAAEKYGDIRSNIAGQYRRDIEGWANEAGSALTTGTDKARGYMEKNIEKMEDVESEYKDFSTQALSGQIEGTTARFEVQKEQQLESARRGGAPQSVLDQMSYSMDRDMGAQLQSQVADSAGKYQEGMVQLGKMVGDSLVTAGQMEGQLASVEASMGDRIMQTKIRGLDLETQTKMETAESMQQIEQSYAEFGKQHALQHETRQLRAEELKMQGSTQYANYIMNHPPTAAADLWATMMTYATMPRGGDLGQAKLPGLRQKDLDSRRAALKQKYGQKYKANWDKINPDQFERWAETDPYRGSWYSGSGVIRQDPGSGF